MNGRRVGALALAVLLVVGAYFVRRNVIDDDDPDNSVATAPDPEDATAIVCITELSDVCDALGSSHPDLSLIHI